MMQHSSHLSIPTLFYSFILLYQFSLKGYLCVTVTEVRLLSDSGKTDYVVAGEGFTFSCLYSFDPDEDVVSIVWEKDKDQVYVYEMKKKRGTPRNVLKGRTDKTNDSPSSIIILNSTKEMQGIWTCQVVTQKMKSQNEAFLTIIVDTCKESSWITHSDMVSCTEDITFFCRGMFPKPSPVCGIYNDLTGAYIQSVPFDRIELLTDGTYEISLFRRYYVKEWLNYTGRISFRCYIIIMSTTWRRGIHHKMFGSTGCNQPPPIPNGYYNMTQEQTCWKTPREGTRLIYGCSGDYVLEGPDTLVCHNGSWNVVNMHNATKSMNTPSLSTPQPSTSTVSSTTDMSPEPITTDHQFAYCSFSQSPHQPHQYIKSSLLGSTVMFIIFLFVFK